MAEARDFRGNSTFAGSQVARRVAFLLSLIAVAMIVWSAEKSFVSAEGRARALAAIGRERVESALVSQDVALDWIVEAARPMNWDELSSSATFSTLIRRLDTAYAQSAAIFLADASGTVRFSDVRQASDRKIDVSDRDYFASSRQTPHRMVFGAADFGKLDGRWTFRIAKARLDAEGKWDGIVAIRIAPEFFASFFNNLRLRMGGEITLSRSDGTILFSEPERARPEGGAAIHLNEEAHSIARGRNWNIHAVSRSAVYGFMVSYDVPLMFVVQNWLADFTPFGATVMVLSALLFVVVKRYRRSEFLEKAALRALHEETQHRLAIERHAAALQRMEAIGRFAGGVAHHFNNILPAMSAHIAIAAREAERGPPYNQLKKLSAMVDESRAFLRSMLLVGSHHAGVRERCALSELVRKAIGDLDPALVGRIELAFLEDAYVEGDLSQLCGAILNLVKNAMEASVNTRVRIEILNVDEQTCLVRVIDWGAGMDSPVLERVREPFFTTKAGRGGSGLGLALCDSVVRAHRGQLTIKSQVGKGTTVSILLPSVEQA